MNFITYQKMIEDAKALARKLPSFEAVYVIPRSGFLPGIIISLERNASLGIVGGNILEGGSRDNNEEIKRIIVVDDSLDTGTQMKAARKFFKGTTYDVKYAVLYVTPEMEDKVDYYWEVIPLPRMFEWNFIHHGDLVKTCLDLDGVLADNDIDSEEAFRDAPPLYQPSVLVGAIVTGRLEQYREVTEEWLVKHGIRYDKLIMRADPRRPVEEMKAEFYGNSRYIFFIESSEFQAKWIAILTGKPVLAIETMKVW